MATVASGSVADRPLGRTVAAVARRRLTGELRVAAPGRTCAIGWRDGYVVAAAGNHPADGAVRTALGAGLITSTQASELVRAIAPGADDVVAVGASARLAPEQVTRLRRRVIANRAMRLFAFDAGELVVDDALTLPVAADVAPIDPRVVIYHGVRAHYDAARTLRELDELGETFTLGADAAAAFEAFGFGDAERPALAALAAGPVAARALHAAAPGGDAAAALAALYALAVCGYAELGGARTTARPTLSPSAMAAATSRASPPTAPPAVAAAPPRRRGHTTRPPPRTTEVTVLETTRALIAARRALVDGRADHFAVLGVPRDASGDRVRAAYFDLARQLHPDRITAIGAADLAPDAQRVFAAINAAFGTLSHPGRRAEYEQTLAAGGDDAARRREEEAERAAERLIGAEDHFRRGEMALRRNQLPQAIEELTRAVELNPDECEHHALLAWATWCAAPDKKVATPVARRALERAAAMSELNPTPHLYLGKIARMLGEDDAAIRHLREVLERFPHHGEASSELRLVESRLAQQPGRAKRESKSGLFDRFRKG